MIHANVTSTWVYEHYLVYLYLAVTDSDCFFSSDQLECIRQKVFKNMDAERCGKLVSDVFREFRSHSDLERKDYIKSNVEKYLRTETIRKRVICELECISTSDDPSDTQVMFRFIRRIINSLQS